MAIIQGAITIVLFILILGGLVVIHEVGHFILARVFGIRVLEFGIGFPPRARILRGAVPPTVPGPPALDADDEGDLDRLGEVGPAVGDPLLVAEAPPSDRTLYTLNWLPIGGFVRLDGEDGDSGDRRSFAVQRLWKKLVVLVAGVVMNLLLAFVIFFGIAWLATPQAGLVFSEVQAGSPAETAGLRPGETILAIDGETFDYLPSPGAGDAAVQALRDRAGQTVTLTVRAAAGAVREIEVTLRSPEVAADRGALGIRGAQLAATGEYGGRDLVSAAGAGAAWTVSAFTLILNGLADLIGSIVANPGQAPPVAGPVGIAAQVGEVFWQLGPIFTLYLAGLLSANLALVNILPFPPLDGGRMLVLVLKAILTGGRRALGSIGIRVDGPSSATVISVERLTYLVGFIALFGFLIWITYFDIARLGGGG